MFTNPSAKYRPFPAVGLADRQWPGKTITHPPIWMSTDLRDGNQALIEPMSPEKKLRFFEMLVKIGIKEIEVGFPSASQTDFDFVRMLVEENRIPDDVTIIVLTQARDELIRRTVDSAVGAKRAIVHVYNSVAPVFRRVVFGMTQDEIVDIAVKGTRLIKELVARHPQTQWGLEYSPESFSTTELDFSKRIVDAVSAEWQPTPAKPMIVNLPSTVEASTPNVYADQIEWMCRHLERRDALVVSVHPHNDRGTAVAAAELAVLAGADRVEGCLFGNGERTGNVDLVTLALNLYTQGVHPGLDFSDIDSVRQLVEECNALPVHPRHPYAGDLVFTAFSGSHQDAIKKGFERMADDAAAQGKSVDETTWAVPYLPIDPKDVGRSYEAVIRVNSQSGKGGVAYLLKADRGLDLPRRLQIEFSNIVQGRTDSEGGEVTSDAIWTIFSDEYLPNPSREAEDQWGRFELREVGSSSSLGGETRLTVVLRDEQTLRDVESAGNGPIDALLSLLRAEGVEVSLIDYVEHTLAEGQDAQAASYVELELGGVRYWGVGIDHSSTNASLRAIVSAVNRGLRAAGPVQAVAEERATAEHVSA